MAISAAVTSGPNITTLSDIKFSELRKYFLLMKPRTSFSGSETFEDDEDDNGVPKPVSASQLLKQTTFTDDGDVNEESDIDYKVPAVPNCTENSAVATSTNWKTSQFVNTIKYYYLQQTGADDLNLNISSQFWNNNLDDNIRKWFFIDAIIGSNTATAAATLSATTNNLSIKISSTGAIYGKSGSAATGTFAAPGVAGDGGDAFAWSDSSSTNNYLILLSGAKLYAGGGGGGQGAGGGNGGQGGDGGNNDPLCFGPCNGGCTNDVGSGGTGAVAIAGGFGGTGAGYSTQSGKTNGQGGGVRNPRTSNNHNNSGTGGASGYNKSGGNGGDFGQDGIGRVGSVNNSLTSASGVPYTKGETGGGGNVVGGGTAYCGGGGLPPPGCPITCDGYSTSGFAGGNGVDGTAGGVGGKSIKRSVTDPPYVLITANFTDNIKGAQST